MIRSVCAAFLLAFILGPAAAQQVPADAMSGKETIIVLDKENSEKIWYPSAPWQPPRYPSDLLRARISGCVCLGFFIEPDGTTSSIQVLKMDVDANRGPRVKKYAMELIAHVSAEVVAKARYLPGPENPGRARAYAQLPISFSADTSGSRTSRCTIPDLKAFLLEKMEQRRRKQASPNIPHSVD